MYRSMADEPASSMYSSMADNNELVGTPPRSNRPPRRNVDTTVSDILGTHRFVLPSTYSLLRKSSLADEERALSRTLAPICPPRIPAPAAAAAATPTPAVAPAAAPAAPAAPPATPAGSDTRRVPGEPPQEGGQPDYAALAATLAKPPGRETARPIDALRATQRAAALVWHEIPERTLSPAEERDLRAIENRQHLDPKRFYKSSGSGRKQGELPSRVHFGTVVVGAHEFYSARLRRKERRTRFIDEVLADRRLVKYARDRSRRLDQARNGNRRVVDPASRAANNKKKGKRAFSE